MLIVLGFLSIGFAFAAPVIWLLNGNVVIALACVALALVALVGCAITAALDRTHATLSDVRALIAAHTNPDPANITNEQADRLARIHESTQRFL